MNPYATEQTLIMLGEASIHLSVITISYPPVDPTTLSQLTPAGEAGGSGESSAQRCAGVAWIK